MVTIRRDWYALLLLATGDYFGNWAAGLNLLPNDSVWKFLEVVALTIVCGACLIYAGWNALLALRNLLNDFLDGFS